MTGIASRDVPWDEKSIVKSLFKALALLECFSPETPELSVAELAKRTGIQKATCNRLVMTMTHAGWLMRVGETRYAPTVKLFRIGSTAIHRLDLRQSARPWLERLARCFGDTAYLMVPDGSRIVCLDLATGANPLQLNDLKPGMSMSPNVGAAPLAILAHRPDLRSQLDERTLPAYTEHTTTTLAELERRLAAVREQGYAVSREDYAHGVAAIGAPVFDSERVAVGAISLGGVAAGFTGARFDEIVKAVLEAAADLSRGLGYGSVPPNTPADGEEVA